MGQIKMERVIKNAIRCNKCGEVIESKSIHDFVWCSCGSVAVDGGHDYLRRTGEPDDYVELSIIEENGKNLR